VVVNGFKLRLKSMATHRTKIGYIPCDLAGDPIFESRHCRTHPSQAKATGKEDSMKDLMQRLRDRLKEYASELSEADRPSPLANQTYSKSAERLIGIAGDFDQIAATPNGANGISLTIRKLNQFDRVIRFNSDGTIRSRTTYDDKSIPTTIWQDVKV